MTSLKRTVARSLPLLAVLACTTPGAAPTQGEGGRDVLTQEQLADFQDMDAFEAVRRLRPQWLRTRGEAGGTVGAVSVQAHVDGQHLGDAEGVLRRLPTQAVLRMSYLDSSDATIRFGVGYQNGVILVETRR